MATADIRAILFDIAPEFDTEDATALAKVDRFIGYAANEINRDAYGTNADMATALLAAHKLTVAARKGANQGAVIKERVGDLERGYAAPQTGADAAYAATSYGTEFAKLATKKTGGRSTPFAL